MKRKGALIVAIILMSIGFAAVSTTLVINGNAKVNENTEDFDVIFTKASLDGTDVYTSVIDDTKKIINFKTNELKTLNQTSVLTYEVTNNSSNYDAEVRINCGVKENTEAKYTSIKNVLENNVSIVKAKESVNGTLTVTLNKTSTEEVTEEYTCTLEFNAVERDELGTNIPDPVSFATDSWETIQKAVQTNNIDSYNIGDTKNVDLGDLGTHIVRLSNKSECTTETSETACGFVVEFADVIINHSMNTAMTNVGGWSASEIRTYINNTILPSLPSDLQSVIIDTKVISSHGPNDSSNFTSIDKLYLLSSEEIWGDFANSDYAQNDTAVRTSRQLDYYNQEGVTMSMYSKAIKQYNGSNCSWWNRTALSNFTRYFMIVLDSGNCNRSSANGAYGISPAFRIA